MTEISIPRFMDFHAHVRTDPMMSNVVPHLADLCAAATIMPNVPAIFNGPDAREHAKKIAAVAGSGFRPLMTIQITEETTPQLIAQAHACGVVAGKVYTRGATTASGHGLGPSAIAQLPQNLLDSFGEMAKLEMPVLVHAEMPDSFCLYRERDFIPVLADWARSFPDLRFVMEHITSAEAVRFVEDTPNVAATITPQHLLYDLDAVVGHGLDPYNLCMPIYKTPQDREALVAAMCSGHRRFFAGTDTAPHSISNKVKFNIDKGGSCAGVFVPARVALAVYAGFMETHGDLQHLVDFTSINGCVWYGLEPPKGRLVLTKRTWGVNHSYGGVVPLLRGRQLDWDARVAN